MTTYSRYSDFTRRSISPVTRITFAHYWRAPHVNSTRKEDHETFDLYRRRRYRRLDPAGRDCRANWIETAEGARRFPLNSLAPVAAGSLRSGARLWRGAAMALRCEADRG